MDDSKSTTILAAHEYLRKGWATIPIPRGEKAPRRSGWQDLRLSEEDLASTFQNGCNIGILLGEASGGLVDVDLDAYEALAVADAFLPLTQRVHGRKSKPKSHRWYLATQVPKPEKFTDTDGTCLLELRSTGQQTVVPPSVHPSGDALRWEQEGDPTVVAAADLRCAVTRIAAASILARHWPKKGERHEAALALAGMLLSCDWNEEDATLFVMSVAGAARDEEFRDRIADVRSTARRLAMSQAVVGASRLAKLVGNDTLTRVKEWLALRTPTNHEGNDCGPYRIEDGRICVERTKEGVPARIPLCNFVARVAEEIVLDDGVETARAYMLRGDLATGEKLPQVRIPASRFGAMTWVPEQWGLRAIINAGLSTRDLLREAIQRLSPNPGRRQVFTHTGWRVIDGQWLYMTAGGAVGCEGYEVDLGPELSRYCLPRFPTDPLGAMRLSLELLDIAPLAVTAPIWSAMFRAPLASSFPLDLSLGVEGFTGSLKSTVVALFLSHYGLFERTSLPGAWSSTANQLERRAFVLKDSVFVIDDYAPSPLDAREMEGKATRLLRSQGNLSGRGRLRADLTERAVYPPRGLIVFTGEQHPPGQSILARMPIVEMERSQVNLAKLSTAQNSASRLADAMAGYLLWLAPQMPGLSPLLRETFEGARVRATDAGEHLRVPEALAHLWLGLHCGLAYAEDIHACTHTEAENHRGRCWDALADLGKKQAQVVEGERPTRRFLNVLLAMMSQRRMILLPKDSAGYGRRDDVLVGWEDQDTIYLTPESSYRAVAQFCRDAGEPFPVRQERLMRDLDREGLSECDGGRHTTTAWIGSRTCRVLRLRRRAVEELLGEELPSGITEITSLTGSGE